MQMLSIDILQEECAELIAVGSKIKRFGIDSSWPFDQSDSTSSTNRTRLIQEMGDVLAMISIVSQQFGIGDIELIAASDAKVAKLEKWAPQLFGGQP